jgi:hypothetical protein
MTGKYKRDNEGKKVYSHPSTKTHKAILECLVYLTVHDIKDHEWNLLTQDGKLTNKDVQNILMAIPELKKFILSDEKKPRAVCAEYMKIATNIRETAPYIPYLRKRELEQYKDQQ